MLFGQKLYKIGILFCCFLIAFLSYYFTTTSSNHYSKLIKVKSTFNQKELAINDYYKELKKAILKEKKFEHISNPSQLNVHVYRNDSLIYWNTNQLPISKFSDLYFPANGIIKTQNGWYFVRTEQINNLTIATSFLVKHEYAFQNDYLANNYAKEFDTGLKASLSLDETIGFPIKSVDNSYLFSIVVNKYQEIKTFDSIVLLLLLITTLFLFLWLVIQITLHYTKRNRWALPLLIIVVRIASLYFNWFGFLSNTELTQASLYGTNLFFPNFLEYAINCVLFFLLSYYIYTSIKEKVSLRKYAWILLIIANYTTWFGIMFIIQGLIENSKIPMYIEYLFSLTSYSILAIISIAFLGLTFFIISKTIAISITKVAIQKQTVYLSIITIGILHFIVDYLFINHNIFISIFPILFILLTIKLEYSKIKQKHFIYGMSLMALYALAIAISTTVFNQQKDKSERELFASQLVTERDINTELEYTQLVPKIHSDRFLKRLISTDKNIHQKEFEEGMERRLFNGYWERYELSFYLFKNNSSINNQENEVQAELNGIINLNCTESEINPAIYFVKDYTKQYSYIIRQALEGKDSTKATMYITLKSKKIPEEIGFPRLLISSQTGVLKHLEKYSVAKYHNNRLISTYGEFNYPILFSTFNNNNQFKSSSFDYNNYNHLIHNKSKNDSIVLSEKNTTIVDLASSFSYLFCVFGLLLLPIYIRFYSTSLKSKHLSLSTKTQVTIITIIVGSLVLTGIGSGIFVKNQYEAFASKTLQDKINSIELELKTSWGKNQTLDLKNNGINLNYNLTQLSKIYKTDINVYDPNGFLIGTSRQKIFNFGLLSEQINPTALHTFQHFSQNDFVQIEKIGLLNYHSAYTTLFNNRGKKLGFINLQHFGQQEEIQNQLQQYLISIINIFVLLLVVTTLAAITIANWLTSPLQLLQAQFSKVKINQSNQRIEYEFSNEIGELVKSYNSKIEELEQAAQQLALNERESAWRDMAKQIAHEIKNPLTPMKLSVQHLMRSFDPTDENASLKIKKVCQSLVEQIDALAIIANEFSSFAKIPTPNFETIDIVQLIKNASELFQAETNATFELDLPEMRLIKGDKEQLLRVINNLIKNALQAVENTPNSKIKIQCHASDAEVHLSFIDNGIGMTPEEMKRVFIPYFTTKSSGSGIGLAVVKQIITNHNGYIDFQSEKNVGTQFEIRLPIN